MVQPNPKIPNQGMKISGLTMRQNKLAVRSGQNWFSIFYLSIKADTGSHREPLKKIIKILQKVKIFDSSRLFPRTMRSNERRIAGRA